MIADLVLLAADKTIETGVTKVFVRHQSVGCSPFSFRSFVHVARDPGCFRRSPEFLAGLTDGYRRCLVVFDREGSGTALDRAQIESDVETRLSGCGWAQRAACIVADPEIENWVWSDSPHVPSCLGWNNRMSVVEWLQSEGYWPENASKPPRPKEALQAVLRLTGQPRSSALYGTLAERVSLARCTDPAFLKLRNTLRNWFPAA